MSREEPLIIRTPIRKRLGGLWLGFAAGGSLVMWSNGTKGSGSEILLTIAGILVVMAVYRILTYSVTEFMPGKVPTVSQVIKHFGIFTSLKSTEFDQIDILRRDNILPYCQLYAHSSIDYLKKTRKSHEVEDFESGRKQLPGIIVVDHTTKKECDKYIESIWRFYDLWEEVAEEPKVPKEMGSDPLGF